MPHEDEDRCVHGTCVWFNDERGYGFLLSDGGVSSMVHYTNPASRDSIEVNAWSMRNLIQKRENQLIG